MGKKRWSEALKNWDLALESFPENFDAAIGRGYTLLELREFESAKAWFEKYIAQYPKRPRAYEGLAHTFMKEHCWEAAINQWERLLAQFPKRVSAYIGKGNALVELNRLEDAEQVFRSVKDRFPNKPPGYVGYARVSVARKDWEEALSRWKGVLEKFPNNWAGLVGKGNALLELASYEAATASFQTVIKAHPHTIDGYKGMARVALCESQYELALKRWEILLSKFPDNYFGLLGKGNVLLRLSHFQQAESTFKYLAEQHPHAPDGTRGIARLLVRQHQYAKAISAYRKVIHQFPQCLPAKVEYGNLLMHLRCFIEARDFFQQLEQDDIEKASGIEGLVRLYQSQGQWDLALVHSKRLMKKDPNSTWAKFTHGMILLNLDRHDEAEAGFRQLGQTHCAQSVGLRGLAAVATYRYWQSFEDASALHKEASHRWIEVAERFPQETVWSLYNQAELAIAAGDIERCNQIFNKLIEPQWQPIHRLYFRAYEAAKRGELKESVEQMKAAFARKESPIFAKLTILNLVQVFWEMKSEQSKQCIDEILALVFSDSYFIHRRNVLLAAVFLIKAAYYLEEGRYHQAVTVAKKSIACSHLCQPSLNLIQAGLNRRCQHLSEDVILGTSGIAIMIITCQKNLQRSSFLQNNLYKHLNVPYFFVVGDETLETDFVFNDALLTVKVPDGYNFLPQKICAGLEFAASFPGLKGILKLDDDVWIRKEDRQIFSEFFKQLCRSYEFDYFGTVLGKTVFDSCWHWGREQKSILEEKPYSEPTPVQYCGGGQGYFLSRRSIDTICRHLWKYSHSDLGDSSPGYEDAFVGRLLARYNIFPKQRSLGQFGLIPDVDIEKLIAHSDLAKTETIVNDMNPIYEAIEM